VGVIFEKLIDPALATFVCGRPGVSSIRWCHCPAVPDGLATGQQVTSSTAEQIQVTSQALAGSLGVSGSPLERQRQSAHLTGKF
jgi:hypothetical protein